MIRQPIAAGRFYSSDAQLLTEEVKSHTKQNPCSKPTAKIRAVGIVSPHAGFMYSGDVAGAVYSKIEIPDTIILIGPNHTGIGEKVAIMNEGTWSMPQGEVKIDRHLANQILDESLIAKNDVQAHSKEHSLETQLPFIQFYREEFKIIPICIQRLSLDECKEISAAIIKALKQSGRSTLIVASSDMTHYETHVSASKKDAHVINTILKLNAKELYNMVHNKNITMCGINPTTVMLMCVNEMGAKEAILAKYMTSGEVNGDMNHVVGYAGLIIK